MRSRAALKSDTIQGIRLRLERLSLRHISDTYLTWLNDPVIQYYTRRRGKKTSKKALQTFVKQTRQSGDWHFALIEKNTNAHIGNISLNAVDQHNQSAEISIMIGDKTTWGKGYAKEAIKMLSEFAFSKLKLHRLWAESPNPAFNKLIAQLGWTQEGIKRQAFTFDKTYGDLICWSLLKNERQEKTQKRSIALFMTQDSPMGLTYLEAMLNHNYIPTCIVVSHTPKLTQMAIETVNERTKGKFVWKTMNELITNTGMPVYTVTDHSSKESAKILARHAIDIVVLGGTGIIKKEILLVPRIGVINVHPGMLPQYRGCSAVEWALYNNDPVGATCHFVTEHIDEGLIIYRQRARIIRGDNYADVRLKAYRLQPEALIKGLKILAKINYKDYLIENINGTYYDPIEPKKLAIAKERLTTKNYRHYTT